MNGQVEKGCAIVDASNICLQEKSSGLNDWYDHLRWFVKMIISLKITRHWSGMRSGKGT